jgi:hypothetical protein
MATATIMDTTTTTTTTTRILVANIPEVRIIPDEVL